MAITTPFTELFGVDHPLVLAPMGGVSGGALAAAVSEAGGLGLVGGGYGDPRWLERELQLVAGATGKPWGVGVITWAVGEDIVRLALSWRPAAVFLSFGDPAPFGALVKEAGTRLICQVQDVAGARQAAAAGADVIVAQGTEAGGHGSRRATLPLVPAVADAVAPVPVLAAGGIADGRGVAAALMLGAQGAVLGTRFCATPEALYPAWAKKQLVAGGGTRPAGPRCSTSPGGWTGQARIPAARCATPSWSAGTDTRPNCGPIPAPATASPAGIRPAIPTSPWSGREKGPTSSPPSSRPGTW